MEVDQTNEPPRSFIAERIIQFKRYVRGKKVLKYSLFALGTFASVAIIVMYYIYYAMDPSVSEDKEFAKDSQMAHKEKGKKKASTARITADSSERREDAHTAEEPSNALSNKNSSLAPEADPLVVKKDEKTFYSAAKSDPKILATEIGKETTVEEIASVYSNSILAKDKMCNDNLCGRCRGCMFYDDLELYDQLVSAAKVYPSTVLYDTTGALTDFVDEIDNLYSNLCEDYMKHLAEELANNRILHIHLRFTSPSNQISNKAPLVCSIFTEGVDGCTAHRFRLQNILKVNSRTFMEIFESSFKYKGYNLRASLKEICRSIGSLKSGESTEATFTMSHAGIVDASSLPSDGKIRKVPVKLTSEQEKCLKKLKEVEYCIEYYDMNKKKQVETVEKYKFAHVVSLFGEPKKSVKKSDLFIAFSPTPSRELEGFFDGAIGFFRNLVQLPDREKKDRNENKYYGSEEVYGVSLLSSISSWKYGKTPIHIKVVAKEEMIESVKICGTTVKRPCTIEEALNVFSLFDQAVILSNTASAEFVQTAKDMLTLLNYKKNKDSVVINIQQNGKSIAGEILMRDSRKNLVHERQYLFSLPSCLEKALSTNTKEPWLCTFMQAFAFAVCESKPSTSNSLKEVITQKHFLGSATAQSADKTVSEDSLDALDELYRYLSDKNGKAVKYVILLVGDSLFLKLSRENELQIDTTYYSYKNKDIVASLRGAFKSNLAFGIFNKKDLVAWSGVKVAYNLYRESLDSVSWNVVDYAYYRLYLAARPLFNIIKRGNLMDVKLSSESASLEENFFERLTSLGRFSTVSLCHPILPIILDSKKGTSLNFQIEMVEKNIKASAGETSCKIDIKCGTFKETVELDFVELGKTTDSTNKEEAAIRQIFTRILNLPKVSKDSETDPKVFMDVHLETLPHSPFLRVVVREKQTTPNEKATLNPIYKINLNLDKVKETAKSMVKEAGDITNADLPVLTNGNIGVLLALLA
ncbi:hypothetical protein NEMIN01_0627 [Nematocida minor]|uniref:uncharacterized protein n=1 Tax=Nematocida minor TaxID=1912983 RepID=UPI00222005F2|nr:uncharacterized protein NEMIN01_0627 [Nematocida minor]KAI5189674.1 hypothetical protein NEMIN01_0627 [Nematocida minor]